MMNTGEVVRHETDLMECALDAGETAANVCWAVDRPFRIDTLKQEGPFVGAGLFVDEVQIGLKIVQDYPVPLVAFPAKKLPTALPGERVQLRIRSERDDAVRLRLRLTGLTVDDAPRQYDLRAPYPVDLAPTPTPGQITGARPCSSCGLLYFGFGLVCSPMCAILATNKTYGKLAKPVYVEEPPPRSAQRALTIGESSFTLTDAAGRAACTFSFGKDGVGRVKLGPSLATDEAARELARLAARHLNTAARHDAERSRLADECGRLESENKDLLVENARLRRDVERLGKRR